MHRKFICLALIPVLLWISGCGEQARREPVMPFAVGDSFAAGGTEPAPERWWLLLDDPRLAELIEEGVTRNFSIRIAWDRLRQFEQTAIKAGADLYPDVIYTGDAARSYSGSTRTSDFAAGLSAAYETDLWGRVRSVSEAARLDAAAAQEDVDAAAVTLSASIARTWYELMEIKLQQQLIRGQLEANEKVLRIVRTQFRQGQANAADVFRQQQLVEATRGQLIQVQDADVILQHGLSVLLGRRPGQWWDETEAQLANLSPLPATGLPSELVQRRPDLRSAARVIEAEDLRVSAAVADRYPRLLLTASTETSAEKIGELFDDWVSVLAAGVAGPLFDAGFRRAEVERTRAVLSEAIHTYAQNVLTAIREVEDALSREAYQRQYIESLEQQLALARKTYDQTRVSYLRGQIDYIRVLESLVSQQGLERSLLAAQRLLIEYRIDLYRALAGGWELERPEPARLETNSLVTEAANDGNESLL